MNNRLLIGCKHCENTLFYRNQTLITAEGFTQPIFPTFTQFTDTEIYALFAEGMYQCPFCENTLHFTAHLQDVILELLKTPCITNLLDADVQFLSETQAIHIPYEANPYSLASYFAEKNESIANTDFPLDSLFRTLMIALQDLDLTKWHIQTNPLHFDTYHYLVKHS